MWLPSRAEGCGRATNLIHGVAGTGQVPQTAEAIYHSQSVPTFTTGDEQVQIRRIIHP